MRALKTLKGLFFIFAICFAAVSIIIPASWLYTAQTLPIPIESASDIELHLRHSIESERQSEQMHKRPSERADVTWPRPDFSKLPKHLVAFFITETGCPTYFQTPREDGWPWMKRVLNSLRRKQMSGDGGCELIIARQLAERLGAKTPMQMAVAADRIHRFLQKDQLVAFHLQSVQFEDGLIGVEDAVEVSLQKKLADLSVAEYAEFQLAIPPLDFWQDIKLCANPLLIRQGRDTLLKNLVEYGHISEEMARTATSAPLRCLATKR
jgi:membrane carboxypeptidase/penicillin-binding protein